MMTITPTTMRTLEERAAAAGQTANDYLRHLLAEAAGSERDLTEYQAMMEALRESEARYRALVNHSQNALALHDIDGRFIYVNPTYQALFGYSLDELRAFDIAGLDRLVHPDDRVLTREHAHRQILDSQAVQRLNYRAITRDGRTLWVEANATPIHDAGGQIIQIMASLRDVTERVENEQMLESLANNLPGLILRYYQRPDGSDGVSFISQGVEALYGVSVETALADVSTLWSRIHADDLSGFSATVDESARALSPWEYEWRILPGDGRVTWVNGRGTPTRLADGTVVWNSVLLEITKRKTLEMAQRELIDQLEMAISTAMMGVWSLDLSTSHLEWNDQLLEIYGLTRAEFDADMDAWRTLVHPDDLATTEAELQRVFTGGQVYGVRFRVIRPDGALRYVEGAATAIADHAGKVVRLVGINMDITEQQRHTQEREALIHDLEARTAELERFTYTVSHDLKSPLITIRGFLGLLEQDALSGDIERLQSDIAHITQAADKMQSLLDELLQLSRVGRVINPPTEINLNALVAEVLGLLHGVIAARDAVVEVQPDMPVVRGDLPRIREVLQNLVENGVKFTEDRPRIAIWATVDGDGVTVRVRDNGIGIEPAYFDKVFGLFEKLDPATPGSGIGLALAKRIIEAHGGRIWVESEGLGGGSTFAFTLPCTPPASL